MLALQLGQPVVDRNEVPPLGEVGGPRTVDGRGEVLSSQELARFGAAGPGPR
jgi:hypothetical protein